MTRRIPLAALLFVFCAVHSTPAKGKDPPVLSVCAAFAPDGSSATATTDANALTLVISDPSEKNSSLNLPLRYKAKQSQLDDRRARWGIYDCSVFFDRSSGYVAIVITTELPLPRHLQIAIADVKKSAWDAHAIRYEPAFRTRYVAPLGLPPTEEIARSISWGLMQVMGQVAREHGFTGQFLSALCEPAAGIAIGCTVLAAKFAAAARWPAVAGELATTRPGEPAPDPAALAARALELWNGGANPNYAPQVLARVANYRA